MSKVYDDRINSWNFYIESTFGEYLEFARKIIHNNDLQRKRVRTSKTIYSLLKNDLKKGCIMPPLVLAFAKKEVVDIESTDGTQLLKYINENSDDVMILDGLQRTYTLLDADYEMQKEDGEKYAQFLEFKIRLELYVEINQFGILYRMLTLNTGQTPMSARHQLEMLYSNMLNTEIDGIKLVTEVEGRANADANEFVFRNTIDGFHAYMNRNELPMDRQDILENVKMLEHISEEDVSEDLFQEFLDCYIKVFICLRNITNDYCVTLEDLDEYEISETPFGKKVSKVFSTSQALTGFGSAIGKMKDMEILKSFVNVIEDLEQLTLSNRGHEWFLELLVKLDKIKRSSKKIGNAQRMFFHYFFRELFNPETDSYLSLTKAVENGYKKYYSQV